MSKRFYRADRRIFNPGEEMLPEYTYQDYHKAPGQQMEEELERARPQSKQSRKNCLFVFQELVEGERYWRTHHGSYLYEVEIEADEIHHCGDMQLTDMIGAELRQVGVLPDQKKIDGLAAQYWQGECTLNPVLEYLMPSAKVVACLKGKSDMKAHLREHVTRYDPADEPSIEELLSGASEDEPKNED